MRNYILFILLLLLSGCVGKDESEGASAQLLTPHFSFLTDTEYARNFNIEHKEAYIVLSILSPWEENKVLNTYYLVKSDSVTVPTDGVRIKVPVQSIGVNSCSHVAYIDALGMLDKIVASTDPEYVYNDNFRKSLAEGLIENLGGSYDMNFEKILKVNPQVLMVTGFKGVDNMALRVENANISVVYNYEWTEKTVLGRAEWIKFFGELFDAREKADSIFNEIKSEYLKCAELARKATDKPKVLSGTPYKGTWYMPGGESFMAEFYRNAGLNYYYKDNKDNASLELSLETVMGNFLNADIWVGVDVKSLEQLKAQDERMMIFKPVKNNRVYHHLNRVTPIGGNDFWESAMLRPDILLKDFIRIAHPELLPDWELFYMGTVR